MSGLFGGGKKASAPQVIQQPAPSPKEKEPGTQKKRPPSTKRQTLLTGDTGDANTDKKTLLGG